MSYTPRDQNLDYDPLAYCAIFFGFTGMQDYFRIYSPSTMAYIGGVSSSPAKAWPCASQVVDVTKQVPSGPA